MDPVIVPTVDNGLDNEYYYFRMAEWTAVAAFCNGIALSSKSVVIVVADMLRKLLASRDKSDPDYVIIRVKRTGGRGVLSYRTMEPLQPGEVPHDVKTLVGKRYNGSEWVDLPKMSVKTYLDGEWIIIYDPENGVNDALKGNENDAPQS